MARKPDLNPPALQALIARAFGREVPVSFERVQEGVSTQVYRLTRGSEAFFLRAAEEEGENLGLDAELHRQLHVRGVHVPEVVYVEPCDPVLRRSVMITAALPGGSLEQASSVEAAEGVARAAGRDLALLNQVTVKGFGFVRRDGSAWPLAAEFPSYDEFVVSLLPDPWPGRLAELFEPAELTSFEGFIETERRRRLTTAHLAHGDFDVTPIFHLDGVYSGLIDFGEIRGTEPLFDLGHFLLHDRESFSASLVEPLIAGYEEVQLLPPNGRAEIRTSAILLGLRQLCRWISRGDFLSSYRVRYRAGRLRELIDG